MNKEAQIKKSMIAIAGAFGTLMSVNAHAAFNLNTTEVYATPINQDKFANLATSQAEDKKNWAVLANALENMQFSNAEDRQRIQAALAEMSYLKEGGQFTLYNTRGSVVGATVATEPIVLLGSGSTMRDVNTADAPTMTFKTGTTTKTVNVAGGVVDGVVSIGSPTESRRIARVAAGIVDATSTDAINGSQLYAVVGQMNEGIKLKGETGDAVTMNLGGTTNIVGDNNIDTGNTNGNLTVSLKQQITVTGVTTTDLTATGTSNLAGTTITRTEINAGNKPIKNMADGTAPTDGVTVRQLNNAVNPLTTSINNLNTEIGKGWNAAIATVPVSRNSATVVSGTPLMNIGMGETVNFLAGDNIHMAQDSNTNRIAIAVSPNVTFTNANITNGATLAGATFNTTTIHMGGKQIQGVAEGTRDTDVVNVKQLRDEVAKNAGGGSTTITTDDGKTAAVTMGAGTTTHIVGGTNTATSVNEKGQVVVDTKPNVSFNEVKVGGTTINGTTVNVGGKQIENVAEGTKPTDAVTKSQLDKVANEVNKGFNTAVIENGGKVTVTGDTILNTQMGETINIGAGNNIELLQNTAEKTVTVKVSDTPNFQSVNATSANLGGTTFTTTQVNLNNKKIQGVADGTNATDGVNVRQLNAAVANANKGWNLTTTSTGNGVATTIGNSTLNVREQLNIVAGNNMVASMNATAGTLTIGTSETPTFTTTTLGRGSNAVTLGSNNSGSLTLGNATGAAVVISNVAAGVKDTDAVNVAQVKGMINNQFGNVSNTLDDLDKRLNAGTTLTADDGKTAKISIGENTTTHIVGGKNTVTSVNDNGQFVVDTKPNVGFDSVSIGDKVSISGDTVNMGGNVIENVGAGIKPTDAVNRAQLDEVANEVGKGWNAEAVANGGNVTVIGDTSSINIPMGGTLKQGAGKNMDLIFDAANSTTTYALKDHIDVVSVNATTATIGTTTIGKGINNGGEQIKNVAAGEVSATSTDVIIGSQLYATNTRLGDLDKRLNAGTTLTADDGKTAQINIGENTTTHIVGGKNTVTSVNDKGQFVVDTKPNVGFDSVNIGDKVSISGDTVNMGGNVIENVGAGVKPTDAATKGQLDEIGDKLKLGWNAGVAEKGGKVVVTGDPALNVQMGDTITHGAGNNIIIEQDTANKTITTSLNPDLKGITSIETTSGTVINDKGIDNGGKVITNVAPAEITASSSDAVIGAQLFERDKLMNEIRKDVDANTGGIAAAAALGNIQYVEGRAGQTVVGVGTAYFNKRAALGAGVTYTSENGRHKFNVGAASAVNGRAKPLATASWSTAF